jgi:hypothetical protein
MGLREEIFLTKSVLKIAAKLVSSVPQLTCSQEIKMT